MNDLASRVVARYKKANYQEYLSEWMGYINQYGVDSDKATEQIWEDFKANKLKYMYPVHFDRQSIANGLTNAKSDFSSGSGLFQYLEEIDKEFKKLGMKKSALDFDNVPRDIEADPNKLTDYLFENLNKAYIKHYYEGLRKRLDAPTRQHPPISIAQRGQRYASEEMRLRAASVIHIYLNRNR